MQFIFEILIVIFVTGFTEILVYKHMRKIDKKERKRLQDWEFDYVEKLEYKIQEQEEKAGKKC